jgi:hypothetical protein
MDYTKFLSAKTWICALALTIMFVAVPAAHATPLAGLVLVTEGTFSLPGLTTEDPGTLLDSMEVPWSFVVPPPTGGVTSGLLRSAVFMNASGTLDFYYQVVNDPSSSTSIAREASANYEGFMTWMGYRLDGGSLPGGIFDDGTVDPDVVDRDITGIVNGFVFGPVPGDRVLSGLTSTVLVISTDATMYTVGNASIIDGGTATVAAFQPTAIPEPSTALLAFAGVGSILVSRLLRRK